MSTRGLKRTVPWAWMLQKGAVLIAPKLDILVHNVPRKQGYASNVVKLDI